jgi:hypothetical protein
LRILSSTGDLRKWPFVNLAILMHPPVRSFEHLANPEQILLTSPEDRQARVGSGEFAYNGCLGWTSMGELVHGEDLRREVAQDAAPYRDLVPLLIHNMRLLIHNIRLLAWLILRLRIPFKSSVCFISVYLPDSFAFSHESSFALGSVASSFAPSSFCISFVLGALAGRMAHFSALVAFSLKSFAFALAFAQVCGFS